MALYHQGQQIRLLSNKEAQGGTAQPTFLLLILLLDLSSPSALQYNNLRALAWAVEKIGPKILSVEKKDIYEVCHFVFSIKFCQIMQS